MAERCRRENVIAVNDAYRLFPEAIALYACDAKWWRVHDGCPGFQGEKWSSHDDKNNSKYEIAADYGVRLVRGFPGEGLSFDPSVIHYGSNSGFQALNLAILWGASKIILVGYDMRCANGKRHFFGDHSGPLSNASRYETFLPAFETAAKQMPEDVRIINATPGSALKCFPMMDLDDALGS